MDYDHKLSNLSSVSSTAIAEQSCAAYDGYIYCVGGEDGGISTNLVEYAPISSSGVGTWNSSTSYPGGDIEMQSCNIYSGYIYCIGGYYFVSGSDYGVTNAVCMTHPFLHREWVLGVTASNSAILRISTCNHAR